MSTPEEKMPATDSPEIEVVANDALPNLKAALEAAEAKANEGRDQALRAMAELENVRKRAARDVENAHKYALEKFAGELIAVKDTLELGLALPNASAEDLRTGTDATLKLLAKAFEKVGVTELIPDGQAFNPEFHEAMAMVPSADHAANTVMNVVQKGYTLSGRLLRPARVLVARAPD